MYYSLIKICRLKVALVLILGRRHKSPTSYVGKGLKVHVLVRILFCWWHLAEIIDLERIQVT